MQQGLVRALRLGSYRAFLPVACGLLHRSRSLFQIGNEDELLRSLVQDAFHPATTSAKGPSSEAPSSPPAEPPSKKPPTGSTDVSAPVATATQKSAPELCQVRAANAAYEPFARVRRKAYHFTVNEHKGIVNHEDAIEWMCVHCQTFNFMNRSTCRHCSAVATDSHRANNPPVRHVVVFPSRWYCRECGAENGKDNETSSAGKTIGSSRPSDRDSLQAARAKFLCRECAAPFPGAEDWCCPSCHNMNPKAATQCASCFVERPPGWCCDHCGETHNSIFSAACFRCCQPQAPVTESDAVVRCPRCGTRNDVRWELCESCMSPLPALLESVGRSARQDTRAAAKARSTPPQITPKATGTVGPQGNGASEPAAAVAVVIMEQQSETLDATDTTRATEMAASSQEMSHRTTAAREPSVRLSDATDPRDSWWCKNCNVIQRRNASFCDICLQSRFLAEDKGGAAPLPASAVDANTASPGEGEGAPHHVPPGAWQCPYCRQYKDVHVTECCGKPREVPFGYWLCASCHSTNRAERMQCLGCGARPTAAPWECPVCSTANKAEAFACSTCASPHPSLWCCPQCHTTAHVTEPICPGCDTARPAVNPVSISCPVCLAPNAPDRRSCYRCRGRLQAEGWECASCHTYCDDRLLWRCPSCLAPREFDPTEEIWVCAVCETPVASGGTLPVRDRCPRCSSQREANACLSFPSRWRCRRCRRFNYTSAETCVECEDRRYLPDLHSYVHCPHCFQQTILDKEETCHQCGGSLAMLLSASRLKISTAGRGFFAALEEDATDTQEDAADSPIAEGEAPTAEAA